MMKSILSIFLAVALSLVVSIVIFPVYPVTAATTIYVDATNTGDPGEDGSQEHPYDMIQEGIDAAVLPGDTVYVRSGTYTETLSISKSLTLTGEDRDTTIISTGSVAPIISITGQSNVTISNLTIQNDGREGVKISNSNNISLVNNNISGRFQECVKVENSTDISIVGNSINASTRTGMTLLSTNDSTISNNMIFNNGQHGIYLSSSSGNTFTGNTISNNGIGPSGGYGIFVVLSENNEVYNNNFIDNQRQAGTSFNCSGTEFNLDAPIGGNYWNNWTPPEHPDDDNDGFVDSHYNIGSGFWDNLPWTQQDGWQNIEATIEATVDIEPDTLNVDSKGKWITCYIELEESSDAADIDVSTVKLNGTVPAEEKPAEIGDYDEDNIPDLMVKFDRYSVQEILEVGDEGEIIITGELTDDGPSFEGTDTIRVIDKSND